MLDALARQAAEAAEALLDVANLQSGDLFVVGCSTSEVLGGHIGKASSEEAAKEILDGLLPALQKRGIFLAAQCCEHLNRALVIEAEAAEKRGWPAVSVVPQVKAGGAFATEAYARMKAPVMVERIEAGAGLDIGGTLIGMHLRPVAVPVRLAIQRIGEAPLICARTRPKYIGGSRARYE